jgi:hypothetical protein
MDLIDLDPHALNPPTADRRHQPFRRHNQVLGLTRA